MNQRSYRLRTSSAGPRPSGPAETERLAQVVLLDHHKESMPGREPTLDDGSGRVSTRVVAAEAEMRVGITSSDATVSPWGLSSSPHFNITTQLSNTSLSYVPTVSEIARYWSKIADLNLPHLYLAPPLGV